MKKHGIALQVTPSIEREFHSSVIAQLPDLTDEEMQRYNRNKGMLGLLLRKAFMENSEPDNTFRITCAGSYTTSELIARGKYAWSHDLIADKRFPVSKHKSKDKTIELVSFGFETTSDEVLATLSHRGLILPSYEDAFYFGIKFPNEQVKHPIIFLFYEVVFDLASNCLTLSLHKDGRGRCLTVDRFYSSGKWNKNCVFAAIQPD